MKGKEEQPNDPKMEFPNGVDVPMDDKIKSPIKQKTLVVSTKLKSVSASKGLKKYKSKKVGDIKNRVVDNSNIVNQLKKELEMKSPNPDSIRRLRKHIEPISKVTLENDELVEMLYQAGKQAVDEDGARALMLLCAGMTGSKAILEKRLKVPVVDGVISALKTVEQFPTPRG